MWAASNLGADAFLLVYDITSRPSLDALQYFDDLIDMRPRRASTMPAAPAAPVSTRPWPT